MAISIYDHFKALGCRVEPAARANPDGRLDLPYVLRDKSGRIMLRGESRDDLETKMHKHHSGRALPDRLTFDGAFVHDEAGVSIALANRARTDAPVLAKMVAAYNAHDGLVEALQAITILCGTAEQCARDARAIARDALAKVQA